MSPLFPLLLACNADPGESYQQVGYRDGDTGPTSGERGNVKISEVLWSGSVDNDGNYDPTDVYVEFRNEGIRPVNISKWQLQLEGSVNKTWLIPSSDLEIPVGAHAFLATKTDGCFPEPDWVIEDFEMPIPGDSWALTLVDADERLIEGAGDTDYPPFAGGYDLVKSRSMEKLELMFGGRGSEPQSWHFYTPVEVDVPNNDRIAEHCQENTLGSPGRPNSPDYSGAYAAGAFE